MPAQFTAVAARDGSGRSVSVCVKPTVTDGSRFVRARGPRHLVAELSALHNGELAAALVLGGLPADWRRMPMTDLARLALAAIRAHGLDGVRDVDRQSRQIVHEMITAWDAGVTDVRTYRRRLNRIWGSARREQDAAGAAFILRRRLALGEVFA